MQEVEVGRTYRALNGCKYEVKQRGAMPGDFVLYRLEDGWEVMAHGAYITSYGVIAWDYGTGGHYLKKEMPPRDGNPMKAHRK